MQRFVLQENLRRFQARLAGETDPAALPMLRELMAAAERELALFDSRQSGVRRPWEQFPAEELESARAEMIAQFRSAFADSPVLAAVIDPAPGLVFVEINPTYERSSGKRREQLVGQPLFEQFPDNPEDRSANGVKNLYASLRAAADSGAAQAMAIQRYDTPDPAGEWTARYWRTVNTPLYDDKARLIFLLHEVEEITGETPA